MNPAFGERFVCGAGPSAWARWAVRSFDVKTSGDVLANAERRVKEIRIAYRVQAALVRAFSRRGLIQAAAEAQATLEALQTALVLAELHLRAECRAKGLPPREAR